MDRSGFPSSILRLNDAARVELDNVRLNELGTFTSSDQFLGSIAGTEVLGLFPVAVEARLEPGRLRIRVWPDAISIPTHDPRFTTQELEATKRYWQEEAAAAGEDASLANWRLLCDAIGVTRAAWAAATLTPTNLARLGPGVKPVFPKAPMQSEKTPFVPRSVLLPDRWVAIGIREHVRVFEHFGAPIPLDLAVGLDTTPTETAGLANCEGEPIQLPPRMRWMTDFATAVQVGMALDVALAAEVDRLDELVVFGVRLTQTPAQNAAALADLVAAHRFSRGFAFVPQGTPTNNTTTGGTGLPSRREQVDGAFELERRPRAFVPGVNSNGQVAALALGLAPETFASTPAAGAVADVAAEPDGFEPEVSAAMQLALWQVTFGPALEDFLLLPPARAEALREHFSRHVRASGPVPAVRVGRQPYAVLPVTTVSGFTPSPAEGLDERLLPLLRAARTWFAMLRQNPVFDGSTEDALRQLGRSMHLFAETTQQNPNQTGENRWEALAGTLARSTRNTIRDTWRNSRIRATVESEPQPVARPVVDDATAAELAALAAAAPDELSSRPLPTSVLGRMARQAALLEWSRLARAACNACVDVPSLVDLETRAAVTGSDAYIDVLAQAFAPAPPGSGPVAPPTPGTVAPPSPETGPVTPPSPGTGPVAPTTPNLGTIASGLSAAVLRRESRARPRPDDGIPEVPDLPEPPEPPDPRPPRPPRPPSGEPEVTAAELQRIAALVGNLSQPLASCPGAARLASFRAALMQLARCSAERLESELFGVLDVCNHRLDAWFTSVASRRLASLRAAIPEGLVLGGWGYLQDVQRADPTNPLQRAEFIHAPSLDQAATAAVLRSGARRAGAAGSAHADIDLSSRRVRLARWVLEGIRNGRSLSDLLGARFERALRGTPAEGRLEELRAQFPAVGRRGVLDGLRLQQEGAPASGDPDIARGAQTLDETLDAVADALTAEAVYQMVRGNPAGALIGLEEIAAGKPPPALRVTETPVVGTRLVHRIVVALPQGATATGWPRDATPRARAEPLLDAWCGELLGPAARIVLAVQHESGPDSQVDLASLGIGAIDVVLSGRGRGAELGELALRAAATARPGIAALGIREDRRWKDLVGSCEAIASVLAHGEPLRPEAFDLPSVMEAADGREDFGDLPQRVQDATAALAALRDALQAPDDSGVNAVTAAQFGIRIPGALLGSSPTVEQQAAMLAAVEARLAAAASGTPRERLRALFGGDLPGVVTFVPRHPENLVTAGTPQPASLLGGDPVAPLAWLDAVGRVRPKAAGLAEVILRREIAEPTAETPLLIAQAPWRNGDRWIATAFDAGRRTTTGRLSVLIHAPHGLAATQPLGGLLIDAWTDTIPAATRDTAMALRFNNASTRPPQVVLLAVSPDPAQPWSTSLLLDVLQETIVLARMRMQPSPTFSRGGLMPFAWLGQRPDGRGISFSP